MNLPDALNVALGIVLVYVLLSSISSLLLELLTGATRYREEILFITINRLLAGVPDEPWHLSRLVLDRIGRRIPEKGWTRIASLGLSGWLRKCWIKEYRPISPAHADAQDEREDIVQRFWKHAKIRSLAAPGADAPPAMEAGTFAAVVVDIAIPRDAQGVLPDNRLALQRALSAPSDITPAALLQTLHTLGLSSEIPAGATGEAFWAPFRANVAAWFNEATDRARDIYRRTMQRLLLGFGLGLALILNADTIRTLHILSQDRPMREAVAAYAETLAAEQRPSGTENPAPTAPPQPGVGGSAAPVDQVAGKTLTQTREALGAEVERLRELEQIGFPIGWRGPFLGFYGAQEFLGWAAQSGLWPWLAISLACVSIALLKLLGLGITALAVSQGAPFWYDIMNRLIGLRKGQVEPALASNAAGPAKSSAGTATMNPVVPPSPLPLEIGHDLAAPATTFNARKAYWLASASAAAYAPRLEVEALVKLTWKFHECHYFDNGGTQGFCASDEQIVLIAFRGTELSDLNDILADVNARRVALAHADYEKAPVRTVHEGFHTALGKVWDDLSQQILVWTEPKTGRAARQIFITGHSLGGALATLAFARLAIHPDRPVPVLYTFGCPKVGDEAFVTELDRLYPERVFRLINDSDIVPHLPPLPDFHHAGRELNFDTAGALRSEISGLGRLLGYAANGVKSIRNASRKAVDDHGMDYYVARCAALTKTA